MDITSLLISLGSGALGGNAAGKLIDKLSLGTVGNSIAGILGGGLGGQVLGMLGMEPSEGMNLAGILGSVASGGVGGGILMAVFGFIKNMMNNNKG